MITKDTFRNQYVGLSTDDWSLSNPVFKNITNGDAGFEMDTSVAKMWDKENSEWRILS